MVASWSGGSYTANATARIARLMLRLGNWDGSQLIGEEAVHQTLSDAQTPLNGAMGWWTNSDGDFESMPADAFSGQGAGHQVVLAVPSLNLIVVRNGGALSPSIDYRTALRQFLFNPLMQCLTDAPEWADQPVAPYPPSPAIKQVQWAPASTIKRQAQGSDNWPLTWSEDHGRTWAGADWRFKISFGYPTFLNFGKNYEGARDRYVYIYSHDSDSAYEASDSMVLARVPKHAIRSQHAYEYFKQLDNRGNPIWTKEISERGPVFSHPERCYRTGITFNTGLNRYHWCQILPTSRHPQGPRFQGGFGIYDAPEPWGPWTTVFLTEEWDVGPGETSSFPTKWMSDDGRRLHLVFSSDDNFSVRRADLVLKPGGSPP